ncbi:uncharacterized protein MONOS_16545 [Monocercomonoides exilis]|uniref:uncharacterized protein n=1 Tax=Monocercomonoides exilis TaxID=2049356 RepID=UPI00355AA24F|nr:hypothetical protein MONOS_16545 [Monocercomonoides exilis]|eukprot:MONOS_16545.1-p1 / transcript=MONOS_16545.1 / gene=MONOS_16545 / organism=Monocercomonoides_exilis_PA203 / gene_product=unspecified product / transcript_product=unspecified product / location=Mono_scaffold01850:841-1828(-) / protein_length=221 / sequence_SO=supercontig / SO=protein_coding / is_pseudo=false
MFGEGEGEGRGGGRREDTAGGSGCGGDVCDVGGVESEGSGEGGEVENALAVEGETGDCCVVEGERASSEEEEGGFYCYGGCSGDGGCVEVEGRGVIGEVKEDGGDLKGEEGVLEKGATHPKAYSTVAHGLCCILPQASTSLPPFATILFWAMRGSQPLYTALSACPLLYTLFDEVVEPHCWNGDWVMLFPLKNTSFPLPFAAVLPSKKQNVMNFIPIIQE